MTDRDECERQILEMGLEREKLEASVKYLQEELTQARLDLLHGDALRSGYLQAAVEHAEHMKKAMLVIEQLQPVADAAVAWRKVHDINDSSMVSKLVEAAAHLRDVAKKYEKVLEARS